MKALYWQSHHIVERPGNALHADVANPLLHTVTARLVERAVFRHIVVDFGIAQIGKCNLRGSRKRLLPLFRGEANACNHLVCAPSERAQHTARVVGIGGFAIHAPIEPNDGVYRYQQVVGGQCGQKSGGFLACKKERNLRALQRFGVAFFEVSMVRTSKSMSSPRKSSCRRGDCEPRMIFMKG